jgi:hypothetical protein
VSLPRPLAFFSCPRLSITELYPPQFVSAPRLPAVLPCPHLSIALHPPVRECPSLACLLSVSSLFVALRVLGSECPSPSLFSYVLTRSSDCALQGVSAPPSLSFRVLTCSSDCALQAVSAPGSLAFFPCSHLSVALCSSGSECSPLSRFLFVPSLVCRSAFSRMSVPSLTRFLSVPSLLRRFFALQEVSALRLFALFPCPHFSVVLCSPVGECPSLVCPLSVSSLVRCSVLSSK